MAFHFASPAGIDPDADPTCTLGYIRRRLGRRDYGDGRMVTYVSKLIKERGFPAPFPILNTRRPTLQAGVTHRSTWPREAVDCWFLDCLPPDAAAALDAAAHLAAASDMDDAARNLSLRIVGGRGA